jgi:hypothetical protein
MTKKYNFKYQVTLDDNNGYGFAQDEVRIIEEKYKRADGADGLIIISIVRKKTANSYYELLPDFASMQITDQELFSIWCYLAGILSEKTDLSIHMKNICAYTLMQFNNLQKELERKNLTIN